MKSIKYICAQPDELYFAWQVEVMLDNFLSVGIDPGDIHIVVGIQKHVGEWWYKLIEKYVGVGFFFYDLTWMTIGRMDTNLYYAPAIRPYILHKHWKRFPTMKEEIIFYHDCDILFTRTPDFSKFLNDDIWYMSDTRSYIGASYIKSKGEHIYSEMCKIFGIDPTIPIENEYNSGGAQYIMKEVDWRFWRRVQFSCESLYSFLSNSGTDIQSWTADMWTLLWWAWREGYKTKIDPYLNFSMATDTWPKWDKNLIYHNAGAVKEHDGKLFIKDQYRSKLPYNQDNNYDSQFCSHRYFDKVIETGRNSYLIDKQPDVQDLLNQCKSIFIGI